MRVLVFGRGKSGLGAAKLLERLGIEPLLYSDGEPEPELSGIAAVVKSPGVPPRNPLLEKAKRAGIPVYGEVELGYRFSSGSFISVTGTNGKSTTTAVIYHALKLSGRESFIGGNYGIPLSTFALDTTEESFTALELSSFQIEDLTSFRSRVSV
ncbi:Mur ligase family protein, partial [Thermovibrio ammonificans]